MTLTTAALSAVVTGCIAGVAFALAGTPVTGAVVVGVVVVVLLGLVHFAVDYAARR